MGRCLTIRLKGHKHWSVGWRMWPESLLDTKTGDFGLLGDDGHRFYADPFPMRHNGRDFLFVEEFPVTTQRGCISVSTFEGAKFTTPRPVLEEPWHLSYPFVFEHAGEVWMIPESGEARAIYLYRADPFPYRRTREGCLIDGIDAHDTRCSSIMGASS
jgi:hypothetical protein